MSSPAISRAKSRRRKARYLRGFCNSILDRCTLGRYMDQRRQGSAARRKASVKVWLKDTGATWHSTNDPNMFAEMRVPRRDYIVTYGNGVTETAAGIGTVHIPLMDQAGRESILTLYNVLYLPRSSSNIFSSQYFIGGTDGERRTGNEYYGGETGTFIRRKGMADWIPLREVGGSAFLVPSNTAAPTKRPPCVLNITGERASMAYWHKLLGHISARRILEMQKRGMVTGMPDKFNDADTFTSKRCRVCALSLLPRKSNKSNTRTPATRKFEIVSTDLVQLNHRSVKGGCKWAAVYVDHFSRYRWVYGIARKSHAVHTLEAFLEDEVHPRGATLGTLMSDNGGEFISRKYKRVVRLEHAALRFSAPHTQSQNGIAERAIKDLTGKTRCLLRDGRKPASWWLWAMKTACYLSNRTPTKGLPHKTQTPVQALDGTKPDLSHLQPWGCDMYMVIPKPQRDGKLGDVTRLLSMVAYPAHHCKGTYVGYDATKKREYISYHVHHDPARRTDYRTGDAATDELKWRRQEGAPFADGTDDGGTAQDRASDVRGPVRDKGTKLDTDSDDAADISSRDVRHMPPAVTSVVPVATSTSPTPLSDTNARERERVAAQQDGAASEGEPPVAAEDGDAFERELSVAAQDDNTFEGEPRVASTYFETSGAKRARDEGEREARRELAGGTPIPLRDRTRAGRAAREAATTSETTATTATATTIPTTATATATATATEGTVAGTVARQILRGFCRQAIATKGSRHTHKCCEHERGATSRKIMRQMLRDKLRRSDLPQVKETGLCYAAFNSLDIRIPANRPDALASAYARQWLEAEKEEMDSMHTCHVCMEMDEADVPAGANICDSRFVYDIKTDEHGRLERFKVRWVAKGFSQRRGEDYWDTFSPVVRMSTVRMLLALATQEGWDVQQCDVKTAFLEAELDEDIYVYPPEGYGKPGMVYKLKRALYGLKQSARLWGQKLASKLREQGFRSLRSDNCLFMRVRNGKTTLVGVYVDDLVVTGDDTEGISDVKRGLASSFRLKDLGALRQILGCTWRRCKNGDSTFTQTKTIIDLANKFNIEVGSGVVETPAIASDVLKSEWQPVKGSREWKAMTWSPKKRRKRSAIPIEVKDMSKQTRYRSIVGNLLWIARCTRPDIMHITSELTRFMQNPGIKHLARAERVVQYLLHTKDIGIRWTRKQHHSRNELKAYTDASFCDREDGKSTHGHLIYLNGGPIEWSSKGQRNVAKSTCESEYIGISAAITAATAMMQVIEEIGFRQGTIPVYCDNTAAIAISKDDCAHQRTRGIRLRYHHIREEVASRLVELRYCKTGEMRADPLTKNVSAQQFVYLRSKYICSG